MLGGKKEKMVYHKKQTTEMRFPAIATAQKILEEQRKEAEEIKQREASAKKFIDVFHCFLGSNKLDRAVLVFENGDQLILDSGMGKSMAIFYHEHGIEGNTELMVIDGKRESMVDKDNGLLLRLLNEEVVDIK